jgi:hypothetical protein
LLIADCKESKWLPLFQSAVMNEVNFTALKRGEGRFKNTLPIAGCRLRIGETKNKKQ